MRANGEARSTLCEINVKVIRTTERGALVATAFRDCTAVWVPLSQVELVSNEDAANTYTLTLPEWLAMEKGLV